MPRVFKYFLIGIAIMAIAPSAFAGQYSSAFPAYLAEHEGDEMVTAIVTMADQVDLRAVQDNLYAIRADRRLWHETVVLALQAKATEDQADLLAYLSEQAALGNVEKYQGLWVGNIVIVTARPGILDQIAARSDVNMVSPNYQIENIEPTSRGGDEPTLAGHEIGLERIHADQCWEMGITGDGRLVSHLDTGVDGNHPAFADRWAGNDPNYAGHPEWAWFDPLTNTDFPFDSGQHGTHTMGTICGRSTTTNDTVGVAIDAHWISCGVIDRQSIQRTVDDALLSFQWIVDPDENPSTVWDVPDCNSNSWGVMTGHGYPPCDETFWVVLDGCEAAGIVVVFAAGNEGPGSNSLRRPADRATTDLTSFSIGAVDGNNENLPIADFSSRGPSFCTPDQSETIKPEVSAPGVNVRSSVPGGGYQGGWSGTSMATPHVAGVVALIRQANPNLTSEQVRQILLDTAVDYGDFGEDNDYGMGVVNAYEAVLRAQAYLEGWGTLGGIVTDQASGLPIQGAHISVIGRPWGANTRVDGSFYMFMPADTAWVIKVEHPPLHLPIFDTITVVENDTIFQNYALEGKVTVTLRASFGNPVDVSYRSFFIKGSWDSDGFWNAGWPAPAIEVKDDGLGPDPTANDGIFTGQVLLARDMVHTYQWALYSESYGGEAARLQNGANFTITSLVPPTVPTLSVNPSGSDHNWNVSVYGNGGALMLDLTRGVNGRPTKWGSATALTGGVMYTVRFRVMHSTIASYGAGGVGGVDIVYTPPIDGSYDFIFDDRDDSYVIQLTGTEGPPTFLNARSGLDGHIPVSWLPPGTVESQEIAYDDGTLANGTYYYDYTNLMGTMFEPIGGTTIDSVIIHLLTEGDQYWPWPDGTADPVGVSIFLDDGSGYPELDPVFFTEATVTPGEWLRVDVPEVVASGNFWVMFNNLDGGGDDGIGLDLSTDYPANKWTREFGTWGNWDNYAGDFMVRAKVFGGTLDGWMGYDAAPAANIPLSVPVLGKAGLAAGSGTANEAPSATKNQNLNRMAYHPRYAPTHPPTILDTQVLAGYNLYRGLVTNPYNGGSANRVNIALILETSYDDWGTDPNGPIVNGVTYYYQAGAVYDIGGGQFVEVGPSNEATGVAQNHPPANPLNLTGSSLGNLVTLNWDPNTDYDIDSYRVFRKDYNAQIFNLVGTVNHPTTTFQETLPLDGIYTYKIAAVDDGGMQSAGFSNSVYIPIGAIPPRDLSATTDEEFQISLRWKHPGTGGGGDLTVLVIAADNANMFQSELLGFDDVVQVDYYDARNGTPTLGELEPYNVLSVWSNYVMADPVGMGNVLADYVDAGFGGVVLNQFCFGSGWGLSGRIMDEYSPFSQGPTQYVFRNLGDYDPGHPIMEDVFSVSDLYLATVSVINNGEVVASWDDGTPFVGVNPDLPVVCVNAYIGDDRQFSGDMVTLMHNALSYSTGGAEVIPDNYKLYKATSSGGPFNLLITLPGTQKTYVDAPVPNGVDYWYRLTAVYPGPDESDPSNVAQGRGQNYPPSRPFAMGGLVDNRTVTVHWSFTNTMGDWDHFNVYKKLVPGGSYVLAGTTSDSSFVVTIPAGEDGVYAIASSAVDNGAPQLESQYSNNFFAPVGNLPPNAMATDGGLEGHVPVHWGLPGLRPTTTITYDDGTLANAYYYYDYTNLMANMFTATSPVEIETLWVHALTDGDPYWPWPDGTHDPIAVSVFDDDGSGFPGDQVFYQEATGEPGEWVMIPIEGGLQVNGPNFWVCMQNLDGGGDEGIGLDVMTDYPESKWNFEFGSWVQQDLYSGDHMIRATIIDNGRTLTLSENAPTTEIAMRTPTVSPSALAATAGASRSNGSTQGYSILSSSTRSLSPIASVFSDRGGIERPLDTEVLVGYRLYRATAPNVPLDVAHRIRDYPVQGLSTAYDDSAVVNGTTYYYKATAIYDNNSVIEESPGSNEASGTPLNHPPQIPFNLAGSVDNRSISLTWSFFNLNLDLHHFNIYKKFIPGGSWVLAGSSTDSSEVITIPAGEDGVYSIAVTAVDNGTPQLESGYSNTPFFPVGNLPPNSLHGTSNQEGYVPLGWGEPGIRPTTTLIYDDGFLANGYLYFDYTNIMASQFVASSPVEVETLWVHVLTEGDPYWPWPDGTADPVGIMVFDDDGSGFPGDQVFYQEAVVEPGQWITIPIDGGLQLNGPNFWIGMQNLDGGGDEGMGLDAFSDFGQYKWNFEFGSWVQQDMYFGDHMIRATIIDNGRAVQLSEKAPTLELAKAQDSNGDIPQPFDTEVLAGYSIYRGEAPNVPIDAGHKIRDYTLQGISRAYNDSAVSNGTTYYYKVTAVYDNNSVIEESPGSNEISATPMFGATMLVTPAAFNRGILPGVIDTSDMDILNNGGLPLDFSAQTIVDQRLTVNTPHVSQGTRQAASHNIIINDDKTNLPAEPTNPPMLLGRGGPDDFGYVWVDSDEPGGPTYGWIDITGVGELLPMSGDDQNLGPYDLGFDFPFYGNLFSTMNVCSNGWISPTSFSAVYFNYPLPDFNAPDNMIAPFWDDLYPPYGGEYWFYSDGSQAVFSFINVMHISGGGPYTFQIVINSSGSIFYNYTEINYPDDSFTTGIQNGDYSIGLLISYNQVYLHNEMTIKINEGWLSVNPRSGTVNPAGSADLDVIFDATSLADGIYTGSIVVTGWDMNHQVGQTTVPVTLTVGQQGGGCTYVHGDVNNSGVFNGIDVTYGVGYFKGGPQPPYSCECTPGNTWFVAGDVNGNCAFNGIDITYMVSYFKGGALPIPCPSCPPALLSAPGSSETPTILPALKSKAGVSRNGQQD